MATVMRVSLSLDHRAIDGAVGAQFLSALRDQLQAPETRVIKENGGTNDEGNHV